MRFIIEKQKMSNTGPGNTLKSLAAFKKEQKEEKERRNKAAREFLDDLSLFDYIKSTDTIADSTSESKSSNVSVISCQPITLSNITSNTDADFKTLFAGEGKFYNSRVILKTPAEERTKRPAKKLFSSLDRPRTMSYFPNVISDPMSLVNPDHNSSLVSSYSATFASIPLKRIPSKLFLSRSTDLNGYGESNASTPLTLFEEEDDGPFISER